MQSVLNVCVLSTARQSKQTKPRVSVSFYRFGVKSADLSRASSVLETALHPMPCPSIPAPSTSISLPIFPSNLAIEATPLDPPGLEDSTLAAHVSRIRMFYRPTTGLLGTLTSVPRNPQASGIPVPQASRIRPLQPPCLEDSTVTSAPRPPGLEDYSPPMR